MKNPAEQGQVALTQEVKLARNLWRVAPGIFRITDGFPNMYFVQGNTKNAVVDTGYGSEIEVDEVEKLIAHSNRPLSAIVLTHSHPDHVGGVRPLLMTHPDAQIIKAASGEDERRIQTVNLGGRVLTAFPSPGHTKDSQYVFDSRTRTLFTGDNILGDLTGDVEFMADYMGGLHALLSLHPQILCPGHYKPSYDAVRAVADVIRRRELRESQIIDALRATPGIDIDGMFDVVYGRDYSHIKGMATFQIESHLIKLYEEGIVSREGKIWKLNLK